MKTHVQWLSRMALCWLAGWTASAGAEEPPAPITVRLASGRQFTGFVDSRTTDETLWLRQQHRGTTVWRPIVWDRVVRANVDREGLTGEELRQRANDLKTTLEQTTVPSAPAPTPSIAEQSRDARPPLDLVRRVSFDVGIANWDGDVEADGLVLSVFPTDRWGRIVPAAGTLEVELISTRHRHFEDVPRGRGHSFEQLGHWSQSVSRDDYGPNGVTLELPFQADHPEFDTQLAPIGLVHVRFVVPGHGVFEDSIDAVRIRPYAPLRDWYERTYGRRFFDNERTGRPKW